MADKKEDSKAEAKTKAEAADENETKVYYLKPGARHHVLLKGEIEELSEEGDEVELTAAQYKAFGDKFYTEDQWGLTRKERAEAAAEAVANQLPSEPANPEDAQNPKPQGASGQPTK
jgi:hypothetical protein